MEHLTPIFGMIGSICAASLFFPQVYSSYKTKQTKDLAWFSIIIGMVNGVSWVLYGLIKNDPFIYVTNTILFIGIFLLMILKRAYG